MHESYKAMPFTITTHHDEVINNNEPWENHPAYDTTETRFCIVDVNTGEVLDDAQGYGYKTAQKAYAGYSYKNRDKSKDNERLAKKKHIKNWMKQNKSFIKLMDAYAFEIAKGTMAPDDKFDVKFIKNLGQSLFLWDEYPREGLDSTCLCLCQDSSAIYPSHPNGCEHKPLHCPDTAPSRS